ncbi:receptor-binding cancer antigen expressed on SiSo cells [Schistocerca serialis cubense]|uniref:receptor-binding cancer antigen expressed on SiSo cells n=1 Tax=Schistocerca serialis cubense TaxID=2023355 RepID=UPI00214EE977|nr:receptor-binding cancer antigen expressed on SiSo cells [Schistocerca serialis cubense]
MFQFVCNRIKTMLLMFLGIVKRALCCLRRRRRLSGDPVPLTAVGVVPNTNTVENDVQEFQNWNSWPDGPDSVVAEKAQTNPIQQKIEMYRQKVKQTENLEPEEEPDFFQDMTPRITKQPKIVLKTETESRWNDGVSPRLTLDADSIGFPTAELETWEEGSGWEDQSRGGWDTADALREKRRQERQQRALELQQKKQQQQRVTGLGLRIAS